MDTQITQTVFVNGCFQYLESLRVLGVPPQQLFRILNTTFGETYITELGLNPKKLTEVMCRRRAKLNKKSSTALVFLNYVESIQELQKYRDIILGNAPAVSSKGGTQAAVKPVAPVAVATVKAPNQYLENIRQQIKSLSEEFIQDMSENDPVKVMYLDFEEEQASKAVMLSKERIIKALGFIRNDLKRLSEMPEGERNMEISRNSRSK